MVKYLKPKPTNSRMARLAWWVASRLPVVTIGRLRKAEEHADWATAQMVLARHEAEYFREAFKAVSNDVAKLTIANKWAHRWDIPTPDISTDPYDIGALPYETVRIEVPVWRFHFLGSRAKGYRLSEMTKAQIFDLSFKAADNITSSFAEQIAAKTIQSIEGRHV